MYLYSVVEFEQYQPVVYDFATSDFRIHDVVETGVGPLALFPMGHQFAITKKVQGRLDGEVDGAERELDIELPDPHLCRELPDNGGQVKLLRYPVHVLQSNGLAHLQASQMRNGCGMPQRKNGCQDWQPFVLIEMVGTARFELATSRTPIRRAA